MQATTEYLEARMSEQGVAIEGPNGVIAALSVDDAVSLAKNILHLTQGAVEPEETYQKPWG